MPVACFWRSGGGVVKAVKRETGLPLGQACFRSLLSVFQQTIHFFIEGEDFSSVYAIIGYKYTINKI